MQVVVFDVSEDSTPNRFIRLATVCLSILAVHIKAVELVLHPIFTPPDEVQDLD